MNPVVSHRPISVTLAVLWLGLEGAASVTFDVLVAVGAVTTTAFDPAAGATALLVVFALFLGVPLRLAVGAGLYTLHSWARPGGLGVFGLFAALNGTLYATGTAVAGALRLAVALAGIVNLCFFVAVFVQPGAFTPTRLGGPDGTVTSSNRHR